MSWFGRWFGTSEDTGTSHDTVAPEITLVSSTSITASSDVVVLDVTDASPGLRTVNIWVSGSGFSGTQAAYLNSSFPSLFSTSSSVAAITNGLRFSLLPAGGWSTGSLRIVVEAVDQDGNAVLETLTWTVPEFTSTEGSPGYPFRDSVWRWRRRLNRQKCSVVSVAIEDNYSEGPGFTLTALALEIGRKTGLDRVPWTGGSTTNRSGTQTITDGT